MDVKWYGTFILCLENKKPWATHAGTERMDLRSFSDRLPSLYLKIERYLSFFWKRTELQSLTRTVFSSSFLILLIFPLFQVRSNRVLSAFVEKTIKVHSLCCSLFCSCFVDFHKWKEFQLLYEGWIWGRKAIIKF